MIANAGSSPDAASAKNRSIGTTLAWSRMSSRRNSAVVGGKLE
jgi:hypothetical protein